MRIDFATFAFGYQVESGGNTPNWATALGQGKGHKINDTPEINEVLKGMIYSGVPVANVKTKIGRGGNFVSGADSNGAISIAAVFNKVYINDTLIIGGKFILLITKDLTGSHAGRFKLKYGPSNTFDDGNTSFSNQDFLALVKSRLKLADNACWFVSDINIRNQDELILKTFVINAGNSETYSNGAALHEAWSAAASFDLTYKGTDVRCSEVAENVLLYGVPGCGKSYTVKTKYCDNDDYMERAVFHPDYTYSDFVGQIIPKIKHNDDGEKNVTYEFEPGPFTRILEKAVKDTDNHYYLIIEEINRGNAPAIFGDIFQLLDRDENGASEYGISNEDVAEEVYKDKDKEVKIPANLSLLATMNTSDQNVFTLDTAFKRRWTMRHIKNNIDDCKFGDKRICETDISWAAFAKTINEMIIEFSTENLSNEDNRLGAYFVKEEELDDSDKFGEKVLMYLWNDAFRYNHDRVFRAEYRTLDELIDGFKSVKFDVFLNKEWFDKYKNTDKSIDGFLNNKPSEFVNAYKNLLERVKERIPNMRDEVIDSNVYIKWTSDKIRVKRGFVNIYFESDKLNIYTETPRQTKRIGQEIDSPHHNFHYVISYSEEAIEEIVEIIVESYEQLMTE